MTWRTGTDAGPLPATPIASHRTDGYLPPMAKLVIVVAMLLVQVQPLAGAVLCERHHAEPAAACATTTEHHQPGTSHGDSHPDPASDEQCAVTHACAAATPVIRADAGTPDAGPGHDATALATATDRPAAGLRSPPFHPPKV